MHSEVAYSALKSGTINPANSAPYYIGSGFIEPPIAIADGPELIDACVIGRTSDGVVVAFRGTPPIDDRTKPLKQRIRDWCNDFRADLVSSSGLPGRRPCRISGGGQRALARCLAGNPAANCPQQRSLRHST